MDILCFSSTDWDGIWGSRQQVMSRLAARGHRVLFVEQLAGLEHFCRYPDLRWRRWRRWREGLREVKPNLWIWAPPPLLPGRYYMPAIARLNAKFVESWIASYLERLGMIQPVLWLYQPEHAPLMGKFGERMAVYHCIDEFAAGIQGRKRRTIVNLEADLLACAEVVFANSRLTYENKRKLNPNTYRIPSAADVEHFAQAMESALPVHPAIAALAHPIAGYLGTINNRLDIKLLTGVAAHLTDWQFVFVGQVQPWSVGLHPLQKLPNVHFPGWFPFAEMPALIKGMDVCLLPYVDSELARYRSPLKLYEYLAAGKPVVSTDHPEVREFSRLVEIASAAEDFADAVVRAKGEDSPERQRQRVELSQQHSWDHRVDEMEQLIIAQLVSANT